MDEQDLRDLLHDALLELDYVRSAEDLSQVRSHAGLVILRDGMKALGLKDFGEQEWKWYGHKDGTGD